MPTSNELTQQVELLLIYRNNLAQYLHQQALMGSAYVSPSVTNGIHDARNNIRRIKTTLRSWGFESPIMEHPDDEEMSLSGYQTSEEQAPTSRDDLPAGGAVSRRTSEDTLTICNAAIQKMKDYAYGESVMTDFRLIYHEIVSNALEHGCISDDDCITIAVVVTSEYISLTVTNPAGRTFDVSSIQEAKHLQMATNPYSKSGRGLLVVGEIADSVIGASNKEGIKAILYRDRVTFAIRQEDDVVIISTESGPFNPSLKRRIVAESMKHTGKNLILDFSKWQSPSTNAQRAILELEELYSSLGKRIVVLIPSTRDSIIHLPNAVLASTWSEAFEKLNVPRQTCRSCGHISLRNAKFCSRCGNPF